MQYDPQLMARHIEALAALSDHEVGDDDWIETAERLLEGFRVENIAARPEPAAPKTLQEKLAVRYASEEPVNEGPPPPPPGIQQNVVRDRAIAELQARVASGEEIHRHPAPSLNMSARSQGASVSPDLLRSDGTPDILPGGGMV